VPFSGLAPGGRASVCLPYLLPWHGVLFCNALSTAYQKLKKCALPSEIMSSYLMTSWLTVVTDANISVLCCV